MIINCLDITVKSASFSAGDSSEFVCLYKGGIFHCHVNQIQIQLPHLRLTFWISRMDGMDVRMRAKIKTQTKSIGLPTKCKEIPGAEINPLKNPMPKFEALKISRKH